MNTKWMEDLAHLNTRVVAAELSIRTRAIRVVEMTEGRGDTTQEEGRLLAYQRDLRLLRALRDTLLDEVEDEV